MAYQTLNIIGSLTAGVPIVQRETEVSQAHIEAYRALLQQQLDGGDDVHSVGNPMRVGDALSERPSPYEPFEQSSHPEKEKEAEPQAPKHEQDMLLEENLTTSGESSDEHTENRLCRIV